MEIDFNLSDRVLYTSLYCMCWGVSIEKNDGVYRSNGCHHYRLTCTCITECVLKPSSLVSLLATVWARLRAKTRRKMESPTRTPTPPPPHTPPTPHPPPPEPPHPPRPHAHTHPSQIWMLNRKEILRWVVLIKDWVSYDSIQYQCK